jgi:hypothetical protein
VDHCNNIRLNSATGYITPKDMLAGRQQEIHAERDRKLEEARKQRQIHRSKPLDRTETIKLHAARSTRPSTLHAER